MQHFMPIWEVTEGKLIAKDNACEGSDINEDLARWFKEGAKLFEIITVIKNESWKKKYLRGLKYY